VFLLSSLVILTVLVVCIAGYLELTFQHNRPLATCTFPLAGHIIVKAVIQ
jgi:hypothetical protein